MQQVFLSGSCSPTHAEFLRWLIVPTTDSRWNKCFALEAVPSTTGNHCLLHLKSASKAYTTAQATTWVHKAMVELRMHQNRKITECPRQINYKPLNCYLNYTTNVLQSNHLLKLGLVSCSHPYSRRGCRQKMSLWEEIEPCSPYCHCTYTTDYRLGSNMSRCNDRHPSPPYDWRHHTNGTVVGPAVTQPHHLNSVYTSISSLKKPSQNCIQN